MARGGVRVTLAAAMHFPQSANFAMSLRIPLLVLGVVLTGAKVATAQLPGSVRLRIGDALANAASQIDPSTFPRLEAAEADARLAMDRAEAFLRRRTDPTNADRWLVYLKFDELREAIDSTGKRRSRTIGREAEALRQRLVGLEPGLELTRLRAVRKAVDALVNAARFEAGDRIAKAIRKRLKAAADDFRDFEGFDDDGQGVAATERLEDVDQLVGLLAPTGQATDPIARIRNVYRYPNAAIQVDGRLVTDAAGRRVRQCRGVNDCILGTRVVGSASIDGDVTASLLPAHDGIALAVALRGRFASNNRGYNGPVVLTSVGRGHVSATRQITIRRSGVSMTPVFATAILSTDVTSITPKRRLFRRLIRRVAAKRVAEQKPRAERISVERLRQQVGEGFAEQTREATSIQIPDVVDRVRPYLRRLDVAEPTTHLQSTSSDVRFDATLADDDQLASPTPTPPMATGFATVQIHETMINNIAGPALGGRTLSRDDLRSLLDRSGLPLKTAGTNEVDDDEGGFEIDFDPTRPVVFLARDGGLRLGIRGTRFESDGRELKRRLQISARYEIASSLGENGRPIEYLQKAGTEEIDFPGSRRLSASQAGLRKTIEERFEGVFPDRLLHNPIDVPQRSGSTSGLRADLPRRLFATDIAIDRGWFGVRFDR